MSMEEQQKQAFVQGMNDGLQHIASHLPMFFIRTYKQCGFDEREAMLILQLATFRAEGDYFPLPEQIAKRMNVPPQTVMQVIQSLMNRGLLAIDEGVDQHSGVRIEAYNIAVALDKAKDIYAEQQLAARQQRPTANSGLKSTKKQSSAIANHKTIFQMFEEEFGRLLSPMEYETISKWLAEDHYPEALIHHALREAVFAGKLHFRYIDRILLDWQQQRIRTVEQAKQHAAKFRGIT